MLVIEFEGCFLIVSLEACKNLMRSNKKKEDLSLEAPGCFLHNILLRYPLVEAGFLLKSGHCFVKLSLQSGAKGSLYSVINTARLPALASQSPSTGEEARLSQSSVLTKSSLESALEHVVGIGAL